ncbi:MAG: OsmC family protein [Thermonemataceae bacterium]
MMHLFLYVMIIRLQRQNEAFHFIATNEDKQTVAIDASPAIGGNNLGLRPMQMMLAALGGCSAIDIIHILNKQKQHLTDFQIEVEGTRQKEVVPALFETIRLTFLLTGEVGSNQVKRAVVLSVEKYCSEAKTLTPTAKIIYTIILNEKNIYDGQLGQKADG